MAQQMTLLQKPIKYGGH